MGRFTNWFERLGLPCKVVKMVESCTSAHSFDVVQSCG